MKSPAFNHSKLDPTFFETPNPSPFLMADNNIHTSPFNILPSSSKNNSKPISNIPLSLSTVAEMPSSMKPHNSGFSTPPPSFSSPRSRTSNQFVKPLNLDDLDSPEAFGAELKFRMLETMKLLEGFLEN